MTQNKDVVALKAALASCSTQAASCHGSKSVPCHQVSWKLKQNKDRNRTVTCTSNNSPFAAKTRTEELLT